MYFRHRKLLTIKLRMKLVELLGKANYGKPWFRVYLENRNPAKKSVLIRELGFQRHVEQTPALKVAHRV